MKFAWHDILRLLLAWVMYISNAVGVDSIMARVDLSFNSNRVDSTQLTSSHKNGDCRTPLESWYKFQRRSGPNRSCATAFGGWTRTERASDRERERDSAIDVVRGGYLPPYRLSTIKANRNLISSKNVEYSAFRECENCGSISCCCINIPGLW